jgi:hypothetical protein
LESDTAVVHCAAKIFVTEQANVVRASTVKAAEA